MSPEISTILAVVLVSLLSLTGILTLFTNHENVKKFTLILVSLAAGTLIGDVFFHIIPELYHENKDIENIPFFILGGLMLFFVLEKFLNWRHCHNDMEGEKNHKHPVAINNLVADGLHNFIDGIIIAASFLASNEIGVATTIAVSFYQLTIRILI